MPTSLGSLVVRLGLNAAEFTVGLTQAAQQAAGFARTTQQSMQSVQRSAQETAGALDYLKRAFSFVAAAYGLRELKNLSDEYQNASARLSIFATSQENLKNTLTALFGVAQTTRQSLSATVDLYYQLANATQDAGTSQQQLLSITSAINKGLIISGSTGDSAKGVIIQLSQALAAGKLRGQEFNTVNEQGNRILRALAEGLGKNVAALREMANDGKITTDVFIQGFTKGIAGIDKDFEKLPITITGGLTKVTNAIQQYVGNTLNAQGQTNVFAKSLDFVANNFNVLAAAVNGFLVLKIGQVIASTTTAFLTSAGAIATEAAAARAATLAKIQQTQAQLASLAATEATIVAARAQTVADLAQVQSATLVTAATKAKSAALIADLALLGKSQAAIVAQSAAANASLAALTATMGAGARATSIAGRALGLLGGPVGAVVTVLGLGAAAWELFNLKTADSAENMKKATESSDDLADSLQKQYIKLKQLNDARNDSGVTSTRNSGAAERMNQLQQQIAAEKDLLTGFGGGVTTSDNLQKLQYEFDFLAASLDRIDKQRGIQSQGERADKAAAKMKELATDTEKAAQEIKDLAADIGTDNKDFPELKRRILEKYAKKPPVDDTSRKILDGQLKAVEANIAREKDLLSAYEGFLRDTYAEGNVSVKEYYDNLQNARDENLRKTLQAYDDEIAAAELFYTRSKKEVDKQDALNKIDDINSKRTNLLRDAGIVEQQINRERNRVNQEYLDQLGEINARVLELNGNTAAAARIRLETANRIQRNLLSRDNSPAGQAALASLSDLERQQVVQAQINDETKKYSLLLGDLEIQKQQIANARDAGTLTELDSLYKLSDANKEYIEVLKDRLSVLEAIAATSKDPADLLRVRQLKVQLEAIANQTDLVAKKFNDIAISNFADALYDVATGAKSVGDAFKSMARNISDAITRIAANNLSEALFGKGGPTGGKFGDFFSKLFGGTLFSSTVKSGGEGGGIVPDNAGQDILTKFQGLLTGSTAASFEMTSAATLLTTAGTSLITAAASLEAAALASAGGSGGGLFGNLLQGIGGSEGGIPGIGFSGGGYGEHFATGGVARGGWAVLGENGPERVKLPTGSVVYNNQQSRRMGDNQISIVINNPGNNRNTASDRQLANQIRDVVIKGIKER